MPPLPSLPKAPAPFERTAPYPTPIDVSKFKKEADVKRAIRRIFDHYGWFHWMPAANGFGQQGVSDHLALKDGVFVVVEAKFGTNKPRPTQKAFAAQVLANDAYAFCVTDRSIDHLVWFLDSFEAAVLAQRQGQPLPDEHGSRMLNAIAALTEAFRA